ncbi:MAG: trypsin-like peptidase domain-containing protein, partial [Clostridia bacterium]|nr:trypsin-like peptidase domain-containing protein [Clostridia bacterium]
MSEERFDENMNEEIVNEEINNDEIVEVVEVSEKVDEETFYEPVIDEDKRKKSRETKRKIAFIVAGALIFGAVSGSMFALSNSILTKFANASFKLSTTQSYITKGDGDVVKSDIADMVEACMPSIVSISSKSVTEVMTFFGVYEKENLGSGSGIIIGKNDSELMIVTNYHVVANSDDLSVMTSDVEIPTDANEYKEMLEKEDVLKAKVKGYDADKDLAVISVKLDDISSDHLSKIRVATIGDSSKIRAGERVIAIGNSLGYGQSVTEGIISATNRVVSLESQVSQGSVVSNTFIQTDAAINPGNSGGALLNMNGEVIGINSVKIAASGVEGMGYAIPITDVEEIIGELMVRETRDVVDEDKQGFLGVTLKDISSEVAKAYGMPEGVFVDGVSKGSAADKAGIKK